MMFEGKHIHYSPVDNKPLCSYSIKLCKQRRLKDYAFCIRHILEDKSAPFKQCAHVARYNKQKCLNPIPTNENRAFCNSHMQVEGFIPKVQKRKFKEKKEREATLPGDVKLKFADRLRALLRNEDCDETSEDPSIGDDPYAFPDPGTESSEPQPSQGGQISKLLWNCSLQKIPEKNCEANFKPEQAHSDFVSETNQVGQHILSISSSSQVPQHMTNSFNLINNNIKNAVTSDVGKGKLPQQHVPKFTKTMNRLQAKIAQNKLLDKMKKSQLESSQNGPITSGLSPQTHCGDTVSLTIKVEPMSHGYPCVNGNHNDLIRSQEPHTSSCLSNSNISELLIFKQIKKEPLDYEPEFPVSDQINKAVSVERVTAVLCSPSASGLQKQPITKRSGDFDNSCSLTLKSIKKEGNNQSAVVTQDPVSPMSNKRTETKSTSEKSTALRLRRRKDDLFHYGVISSDSEDSDEFPLVQNFNWCSSLATNATTWCSTKAATRQAKQASLKSEMRRYGNLAKKVLSIEECVLEHQLKMARNVVQATQLYPNYTAQLFLKKSPSKSKKRLKDLGLEKTQCCYKSDGLSCFNHALPYTRHCMKHIMYNVDQLLYEHCTAKFADNTQCCVPVFDICHELPLCQEHAKKRDNYNKMASEPKPKKVRKKTKPSALTRPPKRGKKKKRQNVLRPNSLPPSPAEDDSKLNSIAGATDNSESLTFSTTQEGDSPPAEVLPKPERMEAELSRELEENLSPGTIEKSLELPIDTAELARQATKLLEEHDFTEVLNKIPDDAFSDLFTDGRNGEYIPTKEETEELERALAAVSKDVHLAKESLAKLTVTRQDIEELSSNIALPSALISAENLTSSLDANALQDMESLNVMTDLGSLTQAFTEMPHNGIASHMSAARHSTVSEAVGSGSHHLPSTLNDSLLSSHLTNGDTECMMTNGTEYDLGSQYLHSSMNSFGPGMQVSSQDGLESAGGSLVCGVTLPSVQFTNQDGAVSGIMAISGNGKQTGDDILALSSMTGCAPQWLLNSTLALSPNAGYQNGFMTQSGPLLAHQLLSKLPLQGMTGEVQLLSNHMHLGPSSALLSEQSTYEDSMLSNSIKDSIQGYSRAVGTPPISVQETKSTIVAQEGAS